ncbi:MAG: hypothetical protein AAFQ71_15730 [Planctomycetota bacterium]
MSLRLLRTSLFLVITSFAALSAGCRAQPSSGLEREETEFGVVPEDQIRIAEQEEGCIEQESEFGTRFGSLEEIPVAIRTDYPGGLFLEVQNIDGGISIAYGVPLGESSGWLPFDEASYVRDTLRALGGGGASDVERRIRVQRDVRQLMSQSIAATFAEMTSLVLEQQVTEGIGAQRDMRAAERAAALSSIRSLTIELPPQAQNLVLWSWTQHRLAGGRRLLVLPPTDYFVGGRNGTTALPGAVVDAKGRPVGTVTVSLNQVLRDGVPAMVLDAMRCAVYPMQQDPDVDD